jgi:hypothetical protein
MSKPLFLDRVLRWKCRHFLQSSIKLFLLQSAFLCDFFFYINRREAEKKRIFLVRAPFFLHVFLFPFLSVEHSAAKSLERPNCIEWNAEKVERCVEKSTHLNEKRRITFRTGVFCSENSRIPSLCYLF